MIFVFANLGIAVVETRHHVASFGGLHFPESRPGAVVRAHARGTQDDSEWVSAKSVLHKPEVVRRNEKVIHRGEASEAKLNTVVKQLLLIRDVEDAPRLKAKNLLCAERVPDMFPRKIVAPAFRKRREDRAALE